MSSAHMRLFLLLATPLCLAALVGGLLVRSRRRVLQPDALGTISERWLAEHRAAPYDVNR